VDLVKLYRASGDEQKARAAATEMEEWLADQILIRPEVLPLRYVHAEMLLFLDRHKDACNTLLQGLRQNDPEKLSQKEAAQLRAAIAQSLVLYADKLAEGPQNTNTIINRLKLIRRAADFYPAHPMVVRAISDTVMQTASNRGAGIAELRNALLEGADPGIVHFVKGTVAMLNDQPEVAERELGWALKTMPQSSSILNNLAVAKLRIAERTGDQQNVEEALKLVNQAIDSTMATANASNREALRTKVAYFRETKGQALLMQENYIDAVTEFEAVLSTPALKRQAHEGLARAYEALGEEELAQMNAAAVEEIKQAAEVARDQSGENAQEEYAEALKSAGDLFETPDAGQDSDNDAADEGQNEGQAATNGDG
jgi:Tfp pilus assembly protein PilF